jgi:hypothetical protein
MNVLFGKGSSVKRFIKLVPVFRKISHTDILK